MSEHIDRLDRLVDRPPVIVFSQDDRGPTVEYAVLVGWCDIKDPEIPTWEQLDILRGYGLYLDLAEYDHENERWRQVLSSEPLADVLVETGEELPFVFELGPSTGGLAWIERPRQDRGGTPLVLPLSAYVTPAPAEMLDLQDPRPPVGAGASKRRLRLVPGRDRRKSE
jgi:hypothetical protein